MCSVHTFSWVVLSVGACAAIVPLYYFESGRTSADMRVAMISIVAHNAESVNAWDSPSTEIIARRGVLAFRAPRSLGSPKGFRGFAAFLHVSNGDLLSSTLSVLFMQILVEMLNRCLAGPCCTTACFRHVWTQHPPRALSFRLQQRRAHCVGSEDDSNGLHDAELPEELQGALSPKTCIHVRAIPLASRAYRLGRNQRQ